MNLAADTDNTVLVDYMTSLRAEPWVQLSKRPVKELRLLALEYRHMATTARTATVMQSLNRVADRLERMIAKRETN